MRKKILIIILLCTSVWWVKRVYDYRIAREHRQMMQQFHDIFMGLPRLNDTATANELASNCVNNQNFETQLCNNALVIDLGASGLSIMNTPVKSYAYWNIDNDDFTEQTVWIGSEDGFLALDTNGDGIINNQSELFGTPDQSSIAVLKTYDQNKDKQIDAHDPVFPRLKIWQDKNMDGISQPHELSTLADHGILTIGTESKVFANKQNDYLITGEVPFTATRNRQGKVYGLRLTYHNGESKYIKSYYVDQSIQELVKNLPDIPGWGDMPDLHTAMCMDTILLHMVMDLDRKDMAVLLDPQFDISKKVQDIMFQWAQTKDMPLNCRGGLMQDDRRLVFLEKYFGKKYIQEKSQENATRLDRQFVINHQRILSEFLMASELGQLSDFDWINPKTGQTEKTSRLNDNMLAKIQTVAAVSPDPFYVWQLVVIMMNRRIDLKRFPDTVVALNNAISATVPGKTLVDVMVSVDYKSKPLIPATQTGFSDSGILN